MFNFFKKPASNSVELEEAGLLSAIWILASNDENPIMTYQSIIYRLGLPASFDVKALIKKRSELFRPGVPSWRLTEWKEKMSFGSSIPTWIKEIKDEKKRKEKIESLSLEDVFRSQFRAKKETDKSPIEVIDWGLQHIERLRKVEVEKNEIRWKWLKDGLIPILSVVIALGTVLITSYWQYQNIQMQKQLKEYELSFKPKQEGYSNYMQAINNGFGIARKNSTIQPPASKNNDALITHFSQIEARYYAIEPFLDSARKKAIWDKQEEYGVYLIEINDSNAPELSEEQKVEKLKKYLEFADFFKAELNRVLFEEAHSLQ